MKILVAYDGSLQSEKALNKAIEFAEKMNGEITLLAVTEPVCPVGMTDADCQKVDELLKKETETILNKIKESLEKKAIKIETLVRKGFPSDEITQVAEGIKADAIFLGSHGRHGAKKVLLGSVSLRVAEHAPCSVFIVR